MPPSLHPEGIERYWLDGLSLDDLKPAELPDSVIQQLVETSEGSVGSSRVDPKVAKFGGKDVTSQLLAMVADVECWHSTDGETSYASVRNGDHLEHWPIDSKRFQDFLSLTYYRAKRKAIPADVVRSVQATFDAKAKFEGKAYDVALRVGGHGDCIYIDLCDEQWRVVEIDRDGWRIRKDSPIRFRRRKGMLELPEPTTGGSIQELRQFVNVADKDWPLVPSVAKKIRR